MGMDSSHDLSNGEHSVLDDAMMMPDCMLCMLQHNINASHYLVEEQEEHLI